MANPLQISVDDTSPSVSYFPFADTFGTPDVSAGWNPYYTGSSFAAFQGQEGEGNSLHRTSLDGASFSVQWIGTGIQIFGNASRAYCDLTLNGTNTQANSTSTSDGILAEFHDLPNANHTLTITVHTTPASPDSFLDFDKAVITSGPVPDDSNSTFITKSVNDTEITYFGKWSYKSLPSNAGQDYFFHYSQNAGDRLEIPFQGTSITLSGFVSDLSGNYSVTLDNQTTLLSGHSSFFYSDALLFYATGLDDDRQHHLVVQNEEDSVLAVKVGGVNYTSIQNDANPDNSPSSPSSNNIMNSRGTKAAIALACVLTFLLISLLLGYLFIYRPRVRRRKERKYAERQSRSKEAEAGEGVLDISSEARDALGRRGSVGTSFGFAAFRFGKGSRRPKMEDIEINSNLSWSSSKRGVEKTSDPHSQWEAYTIDLTSVSLDGSQSSSRHHSNPTDPPSPTPSSRPPRSPVVAFGVHGEHTRPDSDAVIPERQSQRLQEERESETKSTHSNGSDFDNAIERFLSPRTSEALYFSGTTSALPVSNGEQGVLSSIPSAYMPPQDHQYLDVPEGSPFKVDFVDVAESKRSSRKEMRRSQLSQIQSQADSEVPKGSESEERRNSKSTKRTSQVKFDISTLEPPSNPRFSFLDFGSSTPPSSNHSNDASSTSQHSEPDKSRWSATTTFSNVQTAPRAERTSGTQSVTFNVPPTSSTSSIAQQSTSFPFPVSMPTSSHYPQSSTAPRGPRRPSILQTPSLSVPSTSHYSEGGSVSPTDSVPMSVSDIHFRQMDGSDSGSRRTSTGSRLLPSHPPLPLTPLPPTPTPEMPSTPFIVQKLLGIQPSGPSTPGPSPGHSRAASRDPLATPSPEPTFSVRRDTGSEPSTPFMQRVIEIGSAVLGPRHDRPPNEDQNGSSPESNGSVGRTR